MTEFKLPDLGENISSGDVVSLLVNKSLVVAELENGGRIRYRMLETIRQYAQERLEASGEAERLHKSSRVGYMSTASTSPAPTLRPATR